MTQLEKLEKSIKDLSTILYTEYSTMNETISQEAKDLRQVLQLSPKSQVRLIQSAVRDLIKIKQEFVNSEAYQQYTQDDAYQKALQRLERKVREHIKTEQEIKGYIDALTAKLEMTQKSYKQIKETVKQFQAKNVVLSNDHSKTEEQQQILDQCKEIEDEIKRLNLIYEHHLKATERLRKERDQYQDAVQNKHQDLKDETQLALYYKEQFEKKCLEIERLEKVYQRLALTRRKQNEAIIPQRKSKTHRSISPVPVPRTRPSNSNQHLMKTYGPVRSNSNSRLSTIQRLRKENSTKQITRLPLNFTARKQIQKLTCNFPQFSENQNIERKKPQIVHKIDQILNQTRSFGEQYCIFCFLSIIHIQKISKTAALPPKIPRKCSQISSSDQIPLIKGPKTSPTHILNLPTAAILSFNFSLYSQCKQFLAVSYICGIALTIEIEILILIRQKPIIGIPIQFIIEFLQLIIKKHPAMISVIEISINLCFCTLLLNIERYSEVPIQHKLPNTKIRTISALQNPSKSKKFAMITSVNAKVQVVKVKISPSIKIIGLSIFELTQNSLAKISDQILFTSNQLQYTTNAISKNMTEQQIIPYIKSSAQNKIPLIQGPISHPIPENTSSIPIILSQSSGSSLAVTDKATISINPMHNPAQNIEARLSI